MFEHLIVSISETFRERADKYYIQSVFVTITTSTVELNHDGRQCCMKKQTVKGKHTIENDGYAR